MLRVRASPQLGCDGYPMVNEKDPLHLTARMLKLMMVRSRPQGLVRARSRKTLKARAGGPVLHCSRPEASTYITSGQGSHLMRRRATSELIFAPYGGALHSRLRSPESMVWNRADATVRYSYVLRCSALAGSQIYI